MTLRPSGSPSCTPSGAGSCSWLQKLDLDDFVVMMCVAQVVHGHCPAIASLDELLFGPPPKMSGYHRNEENTPRPVAQPPCLKSAGRRRPCRWLLVAAGRLQTVRAVQPRSLAGDRAGRGLAIR
jgi:hypothetical protein